MKYDIFCNQTISNYRILIINGFYPEIVNGLYYVCSFLDESYLNIFIHNFRGSIDGLFIKSKKISAREENKYLEEMHIQYIQSRWNERISDLLS